ncbi:hypothetical protein BX600DRAFT_99964 [Xylariales sp. PMI_506]|nr:hypothetical protein BX600DRAFT_99964 [Xylariales sp. PMI_506]
MAEMRMMMASPIGMLPNEVLIQVFQQLRASTGETSSLVPVLRVCQAWHALTAQYLLYHHVYIQPRQLDQLQRARGQDLELITSMSLRVPQGYPGVDMDVLLGKRDPIVGIPIFFTLAPTLKNLTTFSYTMEPHQNFLTRHELKCIIEALPETCTNFEIDSSMEQEHGVVGTPEATYHHLCDSIRAILPRMRHVRLRLHAMCGGLFGKHVHLEGGQKTFQPIALPRLETLVVNCRNGPGSLTWDCEAERMYDSGGMPVLTDSPYVSAGQGAASSSFMSITNALGALVAAGPSYISTSAKLLVVFSMVQPFNNSWDSYSSPEHGTIASADIQTQTTTVLPWRACHRRPGLYVPQGLTPEEFREQNPQLHRPVPHAVRLLDGREVMVLGGELEAIAEGQRWKNVRGGGRMPSAVLKAEKFRSSAVGTLPTIEADEPQLQSCSDWKKTCDLTHGAVVWDFIEDIENDSGVTVLQPELRVGGHEFLSFEPIRVSQLPGYLLEKHPIGAGRSELRWRHKHRGTLTKEVPDSWR